MYSNLSNVIERNGNDNDEYNITRDIRPRYAANSKLNTASCRLLYTLCSKSCATSQEKPFLYTSTAVTLILASRYYKNLHQHALPELEQPTGGDTRLPRGKKSSFQVV